MFVIKNKKLFVSIIAFLMLLSLAIFFTWRPSLSIEFTGGSIIEGSYEVFRPDVESINSQIKDAGTNNVRIQPTGEKGLLVRTRDLSQPEHNKLLVALSGADNKFVESSFSNIGPSIGKELRQKAVISIILVLLLIILFIAFAFRSTSRVVSSWKFGLSAIICLIHDILVPVGIFSLLAHFAPGYEIDTLFVTAILAILGYSVADTIVVFDRIRENLKNFNNKETFEDVVGRSLGQTYVRSINTSLTVILAALSIFFFGSEVTRHFSLMLAIGIAAGTYSSILLASPLLILISGKKT